MDNMNPLSEQGDGDAIIVKADEVDESGADISTISPTDDPDFDTRIEARQTAHAGQTIETPQALANTAASPPRPRPILRRDNSAPAPPQQPPPPAPLQQQNDSTNPTDSLSLAQLRRLVTDLPKLEPIAYAYTYEDTRGFAEELEEWFQYTDEDRSTLGWAKDAFSEKWLQFNSHSSEGPQSSKGWTEVELVLREDFVRAQLDEFSAGEDVARRSSLGSLLYIALGAWVETAGLEHGDGVSESEPSDDIYHKSGLQIRWIFNAVELFQTTGAVARLYKELHTRLQKDKLYNDPDQAYSSVPEEEDGKAQRERQQELNSILTIFYVIVEGGRQNFGNGVATIRSSIVNLEPSLLHSLGQLVAQLRWDDSSNVPLTRVLLLFWKTELLVFGGAKDLTLAKTVLRKESGEIENDQKEGFITASPLDYHLFRQEITSKYPAYNPPPPLVPLELENNSILPPLPNHRSRNTSHDNLQGLTGNNLNGIGGSIFNQPVHIATPAPSPPPSPAGAGGKGGKKQNYQTNQNFPFLYPPLDDTSNVVGGKGNAGLQDRLVGKKWEGSDIPASILEAGELFASRMRMSRSVRQLWDVRESFMKFERGWNGIEGNNEDASEENENYSPDDEQRREAGLNGKSSSKNLKETTDEDIQSRLDAIEDFYRKSLPHLQSIVIVLLKVLFANVSALMAYQNGQNGAANTFVYPEHDLGSSQNMPKFNLNLAKQVRALSNGNLAESREDAHPALEELNSVRVREITSKAIAGILLILLKWSKLSHVLKFEYLTQLLLDSNYLPLILKLFAHQDVDRAVEQKNDREDLDFFHFCQLDSNHPPSPPLPHPPSSSSSSEDEAQPPPIMKHRRSPASKSPPPSPGSPPSPLQPRPEVDELGYPTTVLPPEPLTSYSPRFFFTAITHLRLLQKITKRKAHRALLLVQYKSSTMLRRSLKIPQPELRLYTLKLFKSQVPYCGRKWRQSNMRVITAIYLHCKPELRDEWLAGGDVDGVVEEAVPLEQASRSLVHWWHLREYRDSMEGEGLRDGEKWDADDFFARELERMGWGVGGTFEADEEDDRADEAQANAVATEWDGGPLQLEGW